jgi:hypothetical protein
LRTTRKDRKLARIRRDVLLPSAVAFDLEYEEEAAKPTPEGPLEVAFRMVCMGYDMWLYVSGAEGFPSLSARCRRLGRRLVRRKLLYTGLDASTIMAHATPLLLAKTGGDLWGEIDGETLPGTDHHHGLFTRVSDFYPLKRIPREVLPKALAEFEVMETHEPRGEVVQGEHPASPYTQALLDGKNPDDDPELVEGQKLYARDYFINQILTRTVRYALWAHRGPPNSTYDLVEKKVLNINELNDLSDPRLPQLYARSLSAWIAGSRPYREFALQQVARVPL